MMAENLFLIGADKCLKTLTSSTFASELEFQELLARFPDLLTSAEFGEIAPRRWMLVRREAGVPDAEAGSDRWSLDHLFLDQDAVPTLVEVKRATDTRLRREVVAQMLDYAANAASYWRIEDVESWFRNRCVDDGLEPLDELGRLLQTDFPDAEAFWRVAQANLGSGRIRMIFVADRIPAELQRIVEFLNEQMHPAIVVALELRPFENGVDRILSPRLIGATSRAVDQKRILSEESRPESVDDWFSKILLPKYPQREAKVKRLVEMTETLQAGATVGNKYLTIKFTKEDGPACSVLDVTPSGNLTIRNEDLENSVAYASRTEIEHLWSDIRAAGFVIVTARKVEEAKCGSIQLPEIDDEKRWTALRKILEQIATKLASKPLSAEGAHIA